MDFLDQTIAFRIVDPHESSLYSFPIFRQALEALQNEMAVMPEWSGVISACLKDGRSIEIPRAFFVAEERRFTTRDQAEAWVIDRLKAIEKRGGSTGARGHLVANPDDPLDKQVDEAYSTMVSRIVSADR